MSKHTCCKLLLVAVVFATHHTFPEAAGDVPGGEGVPGGGGGAGVPGGDGVAGGEGVPPGEPPPPPDTVLPFKKLKSYLKVPLA